MSCLRVLLPHCVFHGLELIIILNNYQGHPFMASLTENKPLLYSLIVSASAVFVLASGLIPDLNASLQIETFTEEV